MNKVLLIYEDYSELNTVQVTLKKVGFDCVGITSEFSTSEQVLSFNPDIVIACGKGPKVSSIGVGRRLKDMPRWGGKTVLIFPAGIKPQPQDLIRIRMDVVLEAPVQTVRLVQVLASLTNQDDQVLMEKLIKTVAQEESQKDFNFIGGGGGPQNDRVYVGGGIPGANQDDASYVGSGSSMDARSNKVKGQSGTDSEDEFVIGSENKEKPSTSSFNLSPEAETQEVPPDRQKVDWSEMEKQLFSVPGTTSEGAKEAPLFPLSPDTNKEQEDARAISGATPQEDESPSLSGTHESNPENPLYPHNPHAELEEANALLTKKMQKYQELTKDPLDLRASNLKRKDVRLAQKDLKKDWNEQDLRSQDELRREFTKALFRKK